MDTPDKSQGQVPAKTAPSAAPSQWKSSEISRMVTTPMTKEQAAKLVSRLLGGYPSLNLHDPETYIAGVTALLCGFSWWVGERAIEKVSNESKFVPSKAEVAAACQHFAPSRGIVDSKPLWLMIEEATAREREEKARRLLEPPGQTIEEVRAEMRARGLPMGGMAGAHHETPATVKAKYGLTDEQWDAIPDAEPGHWRQLMDKHTPAKP